MNEISKNTSLAELIRSAFSLGFGEAPPWLLEEALRLETRLAAVEAERDAEIARVVRITERLGEEMLRAERNERILAALREPNKIVLAHVNHAYWTSWGGENLWTVVIRAAVSGAEFAIEQPTLVAAAEKEVDEDDQEDTDAEITAMADAAYERAKLRVLAWAEREVDA